jgi:hypothetical protein
VPGVISMVLNTSSKVETAVFGCAVDEGIAAEVGAVDSGMTVPEGFITGTP